MRSAALAFLHSDLVQDVKTLIVRRTAELTGFALIVTAIAAFAALGSWSTDDRSFTNATDAPVRNLLGFPGAALADLLIQLLGFGTIALLVPLVGWGWRLLSGRGIDHEKTRLAAWIVGTALAAGAFSSLPRFAGWPLPTGLGGAIGDGVLNLVAAPLGPRLGWFFETVAALLLAAVAFLLFLHATALTAKPVPRDDLTEDEDPAAGFTPWGLVVHWALAARYFVERHRESAPLRFVLPRRAAPDDVAMAPRRQGPRVEPRLSEVPAPASAAAPAERRVHVHTRPAAPPPVPGPVLDEDDEAPPPPPPPRGPLRRSVPELQARPQAAPPPPPAPAVVEQAPRVASQKASLKPGKREIAEAQPSLLGQDGYEHPPLSLLAEPRRNPAALPTTESLEQNARLLEGVLDEFSVRGDILHVRPGPVVTLYELQPAPGTKSARVIGLADDIARSMSAISARIAVIPGRNAIGIELPNAKRETVYLRELLASQDFEQSKGKLALCLGKTIGGEPVIADLAKMPHLLIAGTTGSGKSVAINTMILSLLYRLKPEQCRLIMIDPKMLELSVYDGIPHLLTPVVTDPKKAVIALKWAVREMEERYRKMSKLGVRNVDGYNARIEQARVSGEVLTRTVQTGFDKETGEAVYEDQEMDLDHMPFIVVIVDEMADLMLVAGKDIEGAVQRLAQMARAAGIHIVMATQRPSVDVITGVIKANFPTRISFQVTSKIDSRTILGEMGAEQLLGQGDMLYMAGGGRISRVHGPFCSDEEVERVVQHLKAQGQPDYIESIIADEEEAEAAPADGAVFDKGAFGESEGADLYDQAVAVVLRDGKASTSYIQRRLQIGYNRAASLMERMEKEGIVSPANHAGKRDILVERTRREGEE
jgi:S-DNA-T family DNA segregation ATPase FtsK/SpoIIIE